MRLNVICSGSAGNGYILTANDGRALALEAGAKAADYFRALYPSQFAGVLVTHEHKDHAREAEKLAKEYGLRTIATAGTIRAVGLPFWCSFPVACGVTINADSWRVTPVSVKHDAVEPCAYIIERDDAVILFATDLQEFPEIPAEIRRRINVLMIEANYDAEIAIRTGANKSHLDRVSNSHLSIVQAVDAVAELINEGAPIETIVLLHLSDDNSNEAEFKARIKAVAPASRVFVADKGLVIDDLTLFDYEQQKR